MIHDMKDNVAFKDHLPLLSLQSNREFFSSRDCLKSVGQEPVITEAPTQPDERITGQTNENNEQMNGQMNKWMTKRTNDRTTERTNK